MPYRSYKNKDTYNNFSFTLRKNVTYFLFIMIGTWICSCAPQDEGEEESPQFLIMRNNTPLEAEGEDNEEHSIGVLILQGGFYGSLVSSDKTITIDNVDIDLGTRNLNLVGILTILAEQDFSGGESFQENPYDVRIGRGLGTLDANCISFTSDPEMETLNEDGDCTCGEDSGQEEEDEEGEEVYSFGHSEDGNIICALFIRTGEVEQENKNIPIQDLRYSVLTKDRAKFIKKIKAKRLPPSNPRNLPRTRPRTSEDSSSREE